MAKEPKKTERILVRKISTKTVFGTMADIREVLEGAKDGQSIPVFDVMGIARSIIRVNTDLGESIKFIGEFEAVSHNLKHDGKAFFSGSLFLPGPSGDLLLGQLSGDGTDNVEFAFTVSVTKDNSSSTGYTYTAAPLIQPTRDDPIEKLRNKLQGGRLKLAAPKMD